jgi:hypothetical protein
VLGLSPSERKGFSPDAIRPVDGSKRRVCGSLGCRDAAEWVVDHPDYGERTICREHAVDLVNKPPKGEESGARPASGASGRASSANRRESAERPSEGPAPRNGSRAARGTGGTGNVKRCGAERGRLLSISCTCAKVTPETVSSRSKGVEGGVYR